jgi:hypothetical protein
VGLAARGAEILASGRPPILEPPPKGLRPPLALSWHSVDDVGAVLFVVQDTRHDLCRGLMAQFSRDEDGKWWDEGEGGSAWFDDPLVRPGVIGDGVLFETAWQSSMIDENRLVYLVPGSAVKGVTEIVCESSTSVTVCPVEPLTGTFIAIGILEPTAHRARLTASRDVDTDEYVLTFGD